MRDGRNSLRCGRVREGRKEVGHGGLKGSGRVLDQGLPALHSHQVFTFYSDRLSILRIRKLFIQTMLGPRRRLSNTNLLMLARHRLLLHERAIAWDHGLGRIMHAAGRQRAGLAPRDNVWGTQVRKFPKHTCITIRARLDAEKTTRNIFRPTLGSEDPASLLRIWFHPQADWRAACFTLFSRIHHRFLACTTTIYVSAPRKCVRSSHTPHVHCACRRLFPTLSAISASTQIPGYPLFSDLGINRTFTYKQAQLMKKQKSAHGGFDVNAEDTIRQAVFRCHVCQLPAPLDANFADGGRPSIGCYV
ncbi:hypothetical protein IW261DRAFT_453365 [Armillaria novae-zelandiae]|uniref:Uncharacterized protein n=1 Tax=Armillaria novae-zelandiae TaxID=153914 RepID=A0AA39UEI4_9AGAR|nr:hypothetical protein IW261DRAFT_453365 [Armillaria novae-zelandiae]